MRRIVLSATLLLCGSVLFAQTYWSSHTDATRIITDKAEARLSFPTEFKLFDLNKAPLQNELFRFVNNSTNHSTIISLPNVDGQIEQFEVVDASNLQHALQAQCLEFKALSERIIH